MTPAAFVAVPHLAAWMWITLIVVSVVPLVAGAIVTFKEQRHLVVAAIAAIGLAGLLIASRTQTFATIIVPCDLSCWIEIIFW